MSKKKSLGRKKDAWTNEQEQLLVTWAEKASGYAWLHNRSVSYFKRRNLYISIPACIFGYGAGSATLLSEPAIQSTWIRGLIGMSAIIAGLLANFQEMFTFKENGEKHRLTNLQFMAFFRDISCELSICPQNRNAPIDYITMKRFEFDKILEQAPDIPATIIKAFNKAFRKISVHKPDTTIGLQTVLPYGKEQLVFLRTRRTLREKKILLKYFTRWSDYVHYKSKKGNQIEIANSNISNEESHIIDMDSSESPTDPIGIALVGSFLQKKRIPMYQNIKIKQNPVLES